MPLHKGLMSKGFKLPTCEKHFHDQDEVWLILSGKGTSYWIDHEGKRQDFVLEAGDAWLIPAGYEHGTEGGNSDDFTINYLTGTSCPGAHEEGHYYMEKEGYIPTLQLKKVPTARYAKSSASRP